MLAIYSVMLQKAPSSVETDAASIPIVLFDGDCALCNASVNFILDHDRGRQFRFEPLQSPLGQSLLLQHHLDPSIINSVTLIEADKVYLRSTAALRICKGLNWPFAALAALVVIPAPVRDVIYDFIARNRYRWFGKANAPACRMTSDDTINATG